MKITRVVISPCNQLGYLNIDLTYPSGHERAGKPLEKVCFIGKNGTGKTTILDLILKASQSILIEGSLWPSLDSHYTNNNQRTFQIAVEAEINNERFLFGNYVHRSSETSWFSRGAVQITPYDYYKDLPNFFEDIFVNNDPNLVQKIFNTHDSIQMSQDNHVSLDQFHQMLKRESLIIYSPTEYTNNKSSVDLSTLVNLNDGLTYGKNIPLYHEISLEHLKSFWTLLIYQVQKIERDRNEFERREDNLKKTKEELIKIFDNNNPDILKIIAEKWDLILSDLGLYFDYKDARKPLVLEDLLVAHIKSQRNGQSINFGSLSSGIKNFILTLGYMKTLYFHRNIQSGIAIFDEPEFSLFPDILLKLVDTYTNKFDFPNTQFFFATHSPLVASQFDPAERICLHFDDERIVKHSKGIAPLGDDPTDLLLQDFQLTEVMPKYGVDMWHKYLELKKEIDKMPNSENLKIALKEFADLRQRYSFPAL